MASNSAVWNKSVPNPQINTVIEIMIAIDRAVCDDRFFNVDLDLYQRCGDIMFSDALRRRNISATTLNIYQ